MNLRLLLAVSSLLLLNSAIGTAANPRQPSSGEVEFVPVGDETAVPSQFRLARHTFGYQQSPLPTRAGVMNVWKVTFPSPVTTPHPNNNTVHCEYFCPTAPAHKPAVIVLHILGGDFDLARLFCRALATRGVAALFLKMPYYGERRQPDSPARMISLDPHATASGITQAVLDIRRAAAWLAAQQSVDGKQIGILGISLGGITAALATSLEPRITKGCFILAGGDMGEVAWQSTEMAELRERWMELGRSKQELFEALRPVDPVTYARPVQGREILMLNAAQDEVVPPACTKALWRAFGKPEIVWWNAGHYTAVRYLFAGAARAVEFFQPADVTPAQSTAK